jgi:lysophospholipase L1-like esterase
MAQGTFLLIGDNYIADFDWQQRMPNFKVHSYGVAKEKVEGFLKRASQIEQSVNSPDIIVIMSGISNVIDGDYTFVDQIRRMVIRLSNTFPETEIIVNSLPNIKVNFLVEEAIHHLNISINTMTRQTGCCYLDNFAKLAKDRKIFKSDGLNLTPESYDRWARSILEYVAFLLEDD